MYKLKTTHGGTRMSLTNSNKRKKNSTSFRVGHTAWNKGTRRMVTYACLVCLTEVTKKYRAGLKHRYCSTSCWAKSPECRSLEIKRREGVSHPNWKGDAVSYTNLHAWVRRHLGTPKLCENCGDANKTKYEWANLSHEYKRDLSDWARLCVPCHHLYDDVDRKANTTKAKYGSWN